MRPNKILLTEKDVLIFLRKNVIEQLNGRDLDSGELYYDDAYLLNESCDLLTKLIKEYSLINLKSTDQQEPVK